MSGGRIDPVWGDDLMAMADAVGITTPTHPEADVAFVPYPCHAHEFTTLALALLLDRWALESADEPIPYWPTDTDTDGYDSDERGEWR